MDTIRYTNGNIEFLIDDLSRIREFRKLITSDRGQPGTRANEKAHADKLFGLMFLLNHPLSPAIQRGLSGSELREFALNEVDLPKTWAPNDLYFDAERRYIEELNIGTIYVKLYKSLLQAFANSDKVINLVNEKIKEQLNKGDIKEDDLVNLIKYMESLNKIADGLPSRIKQIREAEVLAVKAVEDKEFAQGGHEIVDSMDPSKSPLGGKR